MSVRAQPVLDMFVEAVPVAPADERPSRTVLRRGAVGFVLAGAVVALFMVYLRLADTMTVNADGAANARQAWDLLHGNVLLHHWTVSDVSFYTTELPQYALIELFVGFHVEVVHIAAAMTYTLLVVLTAAVAVGRSSGREAVLRACVAVAVIAVPAPSGYAIVLQDPDHTGTAVPLLVTWLLVDRIRDGRRLAWLVALLLVWAQIGDPLALFIGALPLIAVSAVRLYQQRGRALHPLGGVDASLLLAGIGSIVLTQLSLAVLDLVGGFSVHAPIARLSPLGEIGDHLDITTGAMADNFGAHLPNLPGPIGVVSGVIHLVALAFVLVAVPLAAGRLLTRRPWQAGDRINDVLVVAIVLNLAAFVVSTQPGDAGTARQIVAVLPLGAVLAGRLFGGPALRLRLAPAVAVVLAVLCLPLTAEAAAAHPVPAEAAQVSAWLEQSGLRYGIGSYWASHNVTLGTGGRVQVAPTTGTDHIYAYRWETRTDWYDPATHDARFLIVDVRDSGDRRIDAAREQFGAPVEVHNFPDFAVLVYDHNLLAGLPAACIPLFRPSIADCPPTIPGFPGTA